MSQSRPYFSLRRSASTLTPNNCFPITWKKYFEIQQKVLVNGDTFTAYSCGKEGTVLLLIHGGGYSALTWSLFVEEIVSKLECEIFAIDLRGHGSTITANEDDLSLDILSRDVANVVKTVFDSCRPIVVIGHSLGGSLAVSVTKIIPNVVGLCVIDVVEGTAIEALSTMQSYLRSRPKRFRNVQQAIMWSMTCGQTRNLEAARVSIPGQIKNVLTNTLAANESSNCKVDYNNASMLPLNSIREECEVRESDSEDDKIYTWRIDLSKTEPYWNGWFKDLSQNFLDVQIPKVLLLANVHRLDTALTIAQMQGKFQLEILPRCGHAIHEDQPQKVAEIITTFLTKYDLAKIKCGAI